MIAHFKIHRQLAEGLQIRLSCVATGHGSIDAVHPCQGEATLQQLRQRVHTSILAQSVQNPQKFLTLGGLIPNQCVINAAKTTFCTERSQIIGSKAKYRTGKGADQRNILTGIVNGLQKRAQRTDFLRLQQIRTAAGGAANIP